MIGICIPAHNEQDEIDACLFSIQACARHPALLDEAVQVVVVLDACDDDTAGRAAAMGISTLTVCARNVGTARATGAEWLLSRGCRWLAFTDADTRVSPDWLVAQLQLHADVVCGTVGVADEAWALHGQFAESVRESFKVTYRDEDHHRHVHGANLGISADWYRRSGGFGAYPCGEDQRLVDQLLAVGAHVAWSASPRVLTSARPTSRVEGGFATALRMAWAPSIGIDIVPT